MTAFAELMLRRVRGVRVMDLVGAGCLILVVLAVYGSKARAGAEAAKIADTTRQIAAEEQRVRVLQAERAFLTQPERLKRLSTQYLGMAPVKPNREMGEDGLVMAPAPVAQAVPAPVSQAAPAPASAPASTSAAVR